MFQFDWTSHKTLLAIALPMILSNITVPLLGLVDTAVVGHLSDAYYLGGVAIGSTLISFLFSLAGFLRMATTGVTAQAYGKGSSRLQLESLVHGVVIATSIGMLLLILQGLIAKVGFMFAGGSEQVQFYGQQYFAIRIYSAPAVLINLVLLGWMLGMQTAKGPMWHLILTNVVNIGLDFLFVYGFEWGVQGVAAASVIADYTGVLVGAYFVKLIISEHQIKVDKQVLWFWRQWQAIKPLLLINRDILLRTLCLSLCFMFLTFKGARLGDDIVAANAILLNLLMLISFALDGIAYAVEALVGKAVGKQDRGLLLKSIKDALFWSLVFALGLSLSFAWFGGPIAGLMSSIPSVLETTAVYMPWLVALPLLGLWCFLFDGVFIGLTRAKDMRDSTFVSMLFGFFLPWYLVVSAAEHFGWDGSWHNHALWLAMSGFMLARGVTLALRLRYLLVQGALFGQSSG